MGRGAADRFAIRDADRSNPKDNGTKLQQRLGIPEYPRGQTTATFDDYASGEVPDVLNNNKNR